MKFSPLLVGIMLTGGAVAPAFAAAPGDAFAQARWDPHPGARLPVELRVWDEHGAERSLGDYLGTVPILLVPDNPSCRHLCSLVLRNAAKALRTLSLAPGRDFAVAAFDIVPGEKPGTRPDGWTYAFWSATSATVRTLTDAIGFKYAFDERQGEWAHPAGLVVLTADGRISRYLYGVEFNPLDVRLALAEAAAGKTSDVGAQLLLRCFRYDGATGTYTPAITAFLRIAALATCALVVLLVWRLRKPAARG